MIHYTCDRCKRPINTIDQTRHVVQIDIHCGGDELDVRVEDDVDQLHELHQMLEGMSDSVDGPLDHGQNHHGQYDLCGECYRQLLNNPLGRDAALALGFSNN